MYTITATATVHGQTHQLSILFNLRNYLEISGFLYKKEKNVSRETFCVE